MELVDFTDINGLKEQVKISKISVLVCFWDEGSAKCRELKEFLELLSRSCKNEHKDKLKLLLVDTSKCSDEMLKSWGVSSIPALILFSHGEEKYRTSGDINPMALRGKIAALLADKNPIELQFLRFQQYKAHERCLLRFMLKNLLPYRKITEVKLTITSDSFDENYNNAKDSKKCLYYEPVEIPFNPEPESGGIALINLRVECSDEEGNSYKLEGDTWVYIRAEERENEGYFRDINIQAEKMIGTEFSNLIKIITAEKEGKDQTEVINPEWGTVELDLVSVCRAEIPAITPDRRFIKNTPGGSEITTSLLLKCRKLEKNIFIFAKQTLRLGRQSIGERGEKISDIPLLVYPRNEENNRKSLKISKRHAVVSLKRGQFFIKDWDWILNKGSVNGTFVNKKEEPILWNSHFDLNDGDVIDFAGELKLQLATFRQIQTKRGNVVTSIGGEAGDITSACLKRLNNWKDREEYIILVKYLTIGKTSENCLVLNDESIRDKHVKLYYSNDKFWIEDLSGGNTWLGEERLSVNTLYLLREGASLKIGNLSLIATVIPTH